MIELRASDIEMLAELCDKVRRGWRASFFALTDDTREVARVVTELDQVQLEAAVELLAQQRKR